jgi:glycosyltransferase involved in cell wall biosynthesis
VIASLLASQQGSHRVRLVTSPKSGDLRNWPAYQRAIAKQGIPHDRIDLFHRDAATFWPAVGAMQRVIEAFEPDIVHTHAGTPTAVASLALERSSRRSTPLVAHFYSWGLGRPGWMNEMDLWAFSRADSVVCSANAYRDVLRAGGVAARRLRLIPWGLSNGAHSAVTRRTGPPVIGTLGRIERRKGQLDLVRAFASVRERWPAAQLELVGPVAEDAYEQQIRAAIARLHLDDAVRITGHVRDPHRYLARWSAYVSLSSDEGQGLAVLEAMASGVPVVALTAAGIEDYLVDGRTGLVARTASPREVAGLIDRIVREPVLASRRSRSAFEMVRRRYSWERCTAQIEGVYESVGR